VKIYTVGVEQTDMTELVVGFCNFAKAPKTTIVVNIHPRPTRNTHISKAVGTHILYPKEQNSRECDNVFPGT
jgi:hypothetical protein